MTYALASGKATLIAQTWPGVLDNVPPARHWLRDRLAAESTETRDTAETILAEMLGNAFRHTVTDEFTVAVETGGPWIFVALTCGGGPTTPTVKQPDPDALPESGRGMFIIEAMAVQWGHTRHTCGGTTWATIARVTA